jgi:hypothetical protein
MITATANEIPQYVSVIAQAADIGREHKLLLIGANEAVEAPPEVGS